jgi:TonB family protein
VTKPADQQYIPPAPYAAKPSLDQFWFGTDKLWTTLPVAGTWWGLPHYTPNTYTQKLPFWRQGYDPQREPRPNLTVTGRRIDGSAGLLTDGKGNGSWTNGDQFVMTDIDFPTLGCWEITGHYQNGELDESDELTFVVWVTDSLISTAFDKSQYMNAEDGVRFPKALEVPDPEYPWTVQRRGTQGTIVLAVAINKSGGVDKVKVVRRLDPDLDQAAVDAVKEWRFSPAEKNGEAVSFQTLVEMSFSLH